jgi:hypothetical protein
MMYFRFGNAIWQFTNAVIACHYFGVNQIFVRPDYLHFPPSFTTTRGVHVSSGSPPFPDVLTHSFFYVLASCLDPERQPAIKSFRHIFWAIYANFSVFPNTIYFHVRASDIFVMETTHRDYGQPPCHYYLEAASLHSNVSRMIVMSDGGANPCLHRLRNRGAIIDQTSVLQPEVPGEAQKTEVQVIAVKQLRVGGLATGLLPQSPAVGIEPAIQGDWIHPTSPAPTLNHPRRKCFFTVPKRFFERVPRFFVRFISQANATLPTTPPNRRGFISL